MRKRLRVCHERVLPVDVLRHLPSLPVPGGNSRAVLEYKKLWVNGSTLRVRFIGGTTAQRDQVKREAADITRHANLTFSFNNAIDAEIRIAFNEDDGAWSYVGTDCMGIPRDQPTMNLGFMDHGTPTHELMHAIGFGHEHQNPVGGIEWNEENVIRDVSGPPNNWTEEQIRHNILEKYSLDQIKGTEFDPESIMLYFFPASWVKSGKGTTQNSELSETDIAFLASAQAYPGGAGPVDPVGKPVLVNGPAVAESIGAPGEEDLFAFTVEDAGRYVIETVGRTDVVVKLFGPNSVTLLITEDDDSGSGRNARIVVNLIPGQYYVQVRHYNPRSKGAYKISVKG